MAPPDAGSWTDGMAKLIVCSARVPTELHGAAYSQGEHAPRSIGDLLESNRSPARTNHHFAMVFNLQAVHFEDCQGISVLGITLQNSQQHHLTFTRCSHVKANYLRVTSPANSIHTNGVHLVDSRNVHVMDSLISTGMTVWALSVSTSCRCSSIRSADFSEEILERMQLTSDSVLG